MKKFISNFFLRGLLSAAGGPVTLAIIYAILGATGQVTTLSPGEVSTGILSVSVLALFVGGMTAIYQVERLRLGAAILLHGGGLYIAYILVYLINGWLLQQWGPILIFSAIFLAGYALIWLCIYFIEKEKIHRINQKLHPETES